MKTALEECEIWLKKQVKTYKIELHLSTLEAVSIYTKSNEFLKDLMDMNKPMFSFGWISDIDEVWKHHPKLDLEVLKAS